jgi:uncharacterized protein RhaS with RHS repeats
LRYQRHRFYDPSTGQFTQEDPIGLAGGRNLYAFAGGDPINFRDPFGLCPMCVGYALFEAGASLYDAYDLAKTGVAYLRGQASGAELSVTAAGVGVGVLAVGGGYGVASRRALQAGFRGAANVAEQAAFQSLADGVRTGRGVILAGGPSKAAHRSAQRFADEFGGDAADWVKKSTTESVTSQDGLVTHQIHWVENLKTGQIADVKLTSKVKRP